MRLSAVTLADLPARVARSGQGRDVAAIGIVHFGIGAFHRAHQAWYTDACLKAGEIGWGICGVSLRSDRVAQQLNPQDGLYTLTERSEGKAETRLIGAVREVLVAEPDRETIVARLASPDCHIASFTVTEKGYCRTADGSLDFERAEEGFYPLLADALQRRADAGLPGLTLISCDNLSGNGRILGRGLAEWLDRNNPALSIWFARECETPDTMVDRIVPATSRQDLDRLESELGQRDEGAVFTEPFSQWVIEDRFAGPRPGWDKHGVQIVGEVGPYETAKLRMLNGAHSLLAYCGLDAGHIYVHQAIADPQLLPLTDRLMRQEAIPTIAAGADQDLAAYAVALMARFANPSLDHRLIQIAMDGSQKIPQRWLETLAARQRNGDRCPAILTAIAAWLRHVRGDRRTVDDPMAQQLRDTWEAAGAEQIVDAIFGADGLLASNWRPTSADRRFLGGLLH